MQQGWLMSGDENAIEMTAGTYTIAFDIVIPTLKDVIYAECFK